MICPAIPRTAKISARKTQLCLQAAYSLYNVNLIHNVDKIFTAAIILVRIYLPVLPDGQTLSSRVYEKIPGFIVSSLAIWLVSIFARQPNFPTTLMFEKTTRVLAEHPLIIGVRNE